MKVFRTPNHEPEKKAADPEVQAAEAGQDSLGNAARAEALPEQAPDVSLLESVYPSPTRCSIPQQVFFSTTRLARVAWGVRPVLQLFTVLSPLDASKMCPT